MISSSITESLNQPVDKEAGLGEIGKALAVIAGAFMVLFVGIIDAVFTSLFVYMFADFSHNNAQYAIESGDTTRAPKVLCILSMLEMIFAAIIAIVGGLLIILPFVF
jgi:uncharacterized membrane protein